MAGGWTRDGAVQDQIEDTVKDAVLRARAQLAAGASAEECDDCGELIPKRRREALPGVRTCIGCQSERDPGRRLAVSTAAAARTANCASPLRRDRRGVSRMSHGPVIRA